MITCHPQLLMSALENIVRNAIYYGNQQIRVALAAEANRLVIRVEDDGEGVPEDELDSIFRPFYRVSTAQRSAQWWGGVGVSDCRKCNSTT